MYTSRKELLLPIIKYVTADFYTCEIITLIYYITFSWRLLGLYYNQTTRVMYKNELLCILYM